MGVPAPARRRTLIVGEAPGRAERLPDGRCGRRLARLAGVPRLEDGFDVVNLLDEWPGPERNGKGAAWVRAAEAREAAARLELRGYDLVVLLGRRVAHAFGHARADYLRRTRDDRLGVDLLVLPHPSGIVRWWNDPANVRRASWHLRRSRRRP